jgi:hypothetical protein
MRHKFLYNEEEIIFTKKKIKKELLLWAHIQIQLWSKFEREFLESVAFPKL